MTAYLQCFVYTMESGSVVLVRVLGEDRPHGEGLSQELAQEVFPGQSVWDFCVAPQGPADRAQGEGYEILKFVEVTP